MRGACKKNLLSRWGECADGGFEMSKCATSNFRELFERGGLFQRPLNGVQLRCGERLVGGQYVRVAQPRAACVQELQLHAERFAFFPRRKPPRRSSKTQTPSLPTQFPNQFGLSFLHARHPLPLLCRCAPKPKNGIPPMVQSWRFFVNPNRMAHYPQVLMEHGRV